MKLQFITVLVLLFLQLNVVAQKTLSDTLSLSLEEALALAEKNHGDYQSQRLNGQVVDWQLQQALAQFYPQVSTDFDLRYNIQRPTNILPGELANQPGESIPVQFGTNWNNTAGVEINQLVFDAKLLSDLEIIKLNQQLEETAAEVTLQDLKLATVRSYFQVLANEQVLVQLKENASRLKNTVEMTSAKVDAELLNTIELDRVEANYRNARIDMTKTAQLIILSRQLLNLELGLPIDQSLNLTTTIDQDIDLEKDYAAQVVLPDNLDTQPALRFQHLQNELTVSQIDKQHRSVFPTVALYGYFGTNGVGDKFNWFDSNDIRWFGNSYMGLKFTWQLNPFFDNRFVLPQLQIKKQQSALQLETTQKDLASKLAQAETNLKNALEEVRARQNDLAFSQKEIDYLTIRFRNDLASAKDLIDAEKALRSAQAAYWIARYDYAVAGWELRKAKGEI